MSGYWLGVLTTPVLALVGTVAVVGFWRTTEWLAVRWGVTFEVKWRRRVDEVGDYILRRDIWWERSFGPIFVGGWYRQPVDVPMFTRWAGFGSIHGPCLMCFRKRLLTPTPPTWPPNARHPHRPRSNRERAPDC